jgi:hypothetical protein
MSALPNRLPPNLQALFTPSQWQTIQAQANREPNGTGRIEGRIWRGLNDGQREAIIQIRNEDAFSEAPARASAEPPAAPYTSSNRRAQTRDEVRSGVSAPSTQQLQDLQSHIASMANLPADPRVRSIFEPLQPGEALIVGQNFENLFDPRDNPRMNDDEYTPQGSNGNYTEDDYRRHRAAFQTVFSPMAGGDGPTIIGGTELEGAPVAEQFAAENLNGRMAAFAPEGPADVMDQRGIRNAAFSKLPLWPGTRPELVTVPGLEGQRGVLLLQLNVNGQRVIFGVNHWKSMRGGESDSVATNMRIAEQLRNRLEELVGDGGDLNLVDITSSVEARARQGDEHPLLPLGSHEYRGDPDYLDRMITNGAIEVVDGSPQFIPKLSRGLTRENDYINNGTSDHSTAAFIMKGNPNNGVGIVLMGDFNTKYYGGDNSPISRGLGATRVPGATPDR